jgi:predicted nucleotidyltransferase
MPRLYSLEKPKTHEVEVLNEEIRKYEKIRPRLTFNFPLNTNRQNALELIKFGIRDEKDEENLLKLLESEDFVEFEIGIALLSKIEKFYSNNIENKILNLLFRFLEEIVKSYNRLSEKEFQRKISIIQSIIKNTAHIFKEKTTPVLINNIKEIINNKEKLLSPDFFSKKRRWEIITNTIFILNDINESDKALSIIDEIISKIKFKEIQLEDIPYEFKINLIEILGSIFQKFPEKNLLILPYLEILKKDKDKNIKEKASQVLKNIKRAIRENKLQQNQGFFEKNKEIKKYYPWLLSTKKPLFATPEIEQLIDKIKKIEKIVKELQEEFGDDFIGIIILGSTAKGYSKKESDIEYSIVALEHNMFQIRNRFKELALEYKLNIETYFDLQVYLNKDIFNEERFGAGVNNFMESEIISGNISCLFQGLFFGDFKKLAEIQKKLIKLLTPEKWDETRREIFLEETELKKAQLRYNLSEEEFLKIQQVIALLRIPPSYDEMVKLLEKRNLK